MKRSLDSQDNLDEKSILTRPDADAKVLLQQHFDHRKSAPVAKSKEEAELELKRTREQMKRDVATYKEYIVSSPIYTDDEYQYRHITLPQQIARYIPRHRSILLKESEYRRLGLNISSGWEHYMVYKPEPNILLLRRSHALTKQLQEEKQRKDKEKELAEKEKAAAGGEVSVVPSASQPVSTTTMTSTRRKMINNKSAPLTASTSTAETMPSSSSSSSVNPPQIRQKRTRTAL